MSPRASPLHASEPETGENAIYHAADAVDVVRSLEIPEIEVLGHHLEGIVVVTEIDGGSAWNVVPERCEFTVDERTVPGERAALERVASIDGVTLAVDQNLPPMACDDPTFADAVLKAADAAQDGDPRRSSSPTPRTPGGWPTGWGRPA